MVGSVARCHARNSELAYGAVRHLIEGIDPLIRDRDGRDDRADDHTVVEQMALACGRGGRQRAGSNRRADESCNREHLSHPSRPSHRSETSFGPRGPHSLDANEGPSIPGHRQQDVLIRPRRDWSS